MTPPCPRWMQFLPTPAWIEQSEQFDESISEASRRDLLRSWPAILAEVELALRWAVVENNPRSYLKSADVEESKGYCLGRRFFEKHSESGYWVEVECCFLGERPDGSEFVWKRCLVTLYWNLESGHGQLARSRVTGRSANLSRLDYRQIGEFDLENSESFADAEPEERERLARYWPQVVGKLTELARQSVEDGYFSGELDDSGFPNAVDMTGEFYIEDSLGVGEDSLTVFLRFQQRRTCAVQENFDYLGQELGIRLVNGVPLLDWDNTSVI